MRKAVFSAILMALMAVGIMAFTPSASGGETSVYDYHLQVSVHERGNLTIDELNWFRDKLLEDTGLNIEEIVFSPDDLTDSTAEVEGSVAFLFNSIATIAYYTPDDAEPPPEEENFWECVKRVYEECILECDPDENYWYCCGLCEREAKIICAAQHPKGRFSRKGI